MRDLPSSWICPERWTSLMRNLPSSQVTGRLVCPMVFISSIGLLLPMALCGRSSWYSLLKASHFDRASSSVGNQLWSMHSAQTLPLKDSAKALSVGLPGREKSNVTPLLQAQRSRPLKMKSGP